MLVSLVDYRSDVSVGKKVNVCLSVASAVDKTRIFQYLELMRNRGLLHTEKLRYGKSGQVIFNNTGIRPFSYRCMI